MRLLYTLTVFIASSCIRILSVFNPKWKNWFLVRKDFSSPPTSKKKIIIHCASHGEYEQTKLLAKQLRSEGYFVIMSFFSLSGQEIIQEEKEFYDDIVFLPIDLPAKMNAFVNKLNPSLFIINKYEYWYNLMYVLKESKIPFVFINMNTKKNAKYFKWPLRSLHSIIREADLFFVHNEDSRLALTEFGIPDDKIQDASDSRISSILHEKNKAIIIPEIANLQGEIVIYGSVHRSDIQAIISGIEILPHVTHIIVPHELDTENLTFFKTSLPEYMVEFQTAVKTSRLVLVNKLGILKHLYKYASLAYIGGGFSNSIHNSLEAIVEHVPVIAGPKDKGFEEVLYFKNAMYYTIFSPQEFGNKAKELSAQNLEYKHKEKVLQYFNNNNSNKLIIESVHELTK